MTKHTMVAAVLLLAPILSNCGTVKEKTAPCKRPANLTSYAPDPRRDCPTMRAVNDPTAAFAAIGITEPDPQ